MKLIDLAENKRITELTDLFQTVSSMRDPQAVQREFGRRIAVTQRVDGYVSISRRGLGNGEYKITRSMLTEDLLKDNPVNPWTAWEELPTHRGGLLGELIAEPTPKLIPELHLRGDPILGDALADFGSAMIAPLFDEGEALNWSMMLRRPTDAFSDADLGDFLMNGNAIGRLTRTLVMQQEVERLNTRLRNQLDEIASIQRALLPDKTPSIPRLNIAASYLTSNEAGGDFYDFFPMKDDHWGFCIADVSGHGAGAATVVAMMQALLHGSDERLRGPAATMRYLNRQLTAKKIASNFVTALVGSWDPRGARLTISNAGHHFPTVRHTSGDVEEARGAHEIPLGILDDVGYEQETIELNDGDTIVLYTDGITEAFSPPPDREMFGLERLHQALRECSGEPSCVINSIHERLYQHTREMSRDDDQTIVAMRVGDA